MRHARSDARTYAGRSLDVSLAVDPRNREYPVAAKFPLGVELPLTSRKWQCDYSLDQGREGACIGYAGAHWMGSQPRPQDVSSRIAQRFYAGAQRNDVWPGEDYEGTSLQGLMRYWRKEGLIGEYRWIFSADDLLRTLSHLGPVIVASAWPEECFHPDPYGFIEYDGERQGGHATCWTGIDVEREYCTIQQSWGRRHGKGGEVYMRFRDVERMFGDKPRIAFPDKKSLAPYLAANRPWWHKLMFWQ